MFSWVYFLSFFFSGNRGAKFPKKFFCCVDEPAGRGSGAALGEMPNGLSAARYCESCSDTVNRILPVLLFSTPERQNDMDWRNDTGDVHICHCAPLRHSSGRGNVAARYDFLTLRMSRRSRQWPLGSKNRFIAPARGCEYDSSRPA